MLDKTIRFFLENKLITFLLIISIIVWGIVTTPFQMDKGFLPNDPVSVDAIPDIGENQQIVFTKWRGRSPQDIEDQVTYPLTTALLGIPGIKTVRSNSMFGVSSIYVIFEDDVEFYWSRSRILEKLNSLPPNLLPAGVRPSLGPDATALGQIYWYTLEGKDEEGNTVGGWDLQELRTIQDYYVKYALSTASGVSEVASIGGFVKEYQVDLRPNAMQINNVSLAQVVNAVRNSNLDVGAKTIEINRVEYFIRGIGYIKSLEDIENTVVATNNNTPIYVKDIAHVTLGPAMRRGALDKGGAEVVGGVVVARYGSNPLAVINNVKEKIEEISNGLPSKVLKDGTVSKLEVVPFYDRTKLIKETIGTLQEALWFELLVIIIVIIMILMNLRASILVATILPLAVLVCFIAMRYLGVEANIVALSGIAIAIGTMDDIGIVLSENIVEALQKAPPGRRKIDVIFDATKEVASAIITTIATTIISFLPVFTMIAAEGKLFRPLAYTKTLALLATVFLAITVMPAIAHWLFGYKRERKVLSGLLGMSLVGIGIWGLFHESTSLSLMAIVVGLAELLGLLKHRVSEKKQAIFVRLKNYLYASCFAYFLAGEWMPLGVEVSTFINFIFVSLVILLIMGFFQLVIKVYPYVLKFCLRYKYIFLSVPIGLIFFGFSVYNNTKTEFMPSLDEGAYLLMPTSMPHSGMEENVELLKMLDMAVSAIPEVELAVGKLGRVESALDPAPISMFENVINYKSKYKTDENGHKIRFKIDDNGEYLRDKKGALIEDKNGKYFRQWRDHIKTTDDIWDEIEKAVRLPGITPVDELQPIETRLIMLQTGMRANIGIKVKGTNLDSIQAFGYQLAKHLKKVRGVKPTSVYADRIVGKPYLEIHLNRENMARYGLTIGQVQKYLEVAIGGMTLTQTVEGRERYSVRVRYPRALRDNPAAIKEILIPTKGGNEIPLSEIAELKYQQGPQAIKSEDGFLVSYVTFNKEDSLSDTDIVKLAQSYFKDSANLTVPSAISYEFAGQYQNEIRANERMNLVLPIALLLIFLILFIEFRSTMLSLMVFSGVLVAFAGGFIMIWLYGQPWFLNFEFFGSNVRELFQVEPLKLSTAVWVGFLALFGIATDDGVLVGTYLKQTFAKNEPNSIDEIRAAVLEAGNRRVRPAMMTTATTVLALLPVLTSTGRGSDIMIPMAIPSFGGMIIQMITMFTVPVLFCLWQEMKFYFSNRSKNNNENENETEVEIIIEDKPIGNNTTDDSLE